ncbi:hypothetical protein EON65_56795, partial [archaeon]
MRCGIILLVGRVLMKMTIWKIDMVSYTLNVYVYVYVYGSTCVCLHMYSIIACTVLWHSLVPLLPSLDPTQSLNMDDCVSNTEAGFTLTKRKRCAFLLDDFIPMVYNPTSAPTLAPTLTPTPLTTVKYIHLTSNRCYLCLWRNTTAMTTTTINVSKSKPKKHPIYTLMRRTFFASRKTLDVFEIAGCILRLTMYPTPILWEEVDRIYSTSKLFHPNSYLEQKKRAKVSKKGG